VPGLAFIFMVYAASVSLQYIYESWTVFLLLLYIYDKSLYDEIKKRFFLDPAIGMPVQHGKNDDQCISLFAVHL
jgi:hypothetical protein